MSVGSAKNIKEISFFQGSWEQALIEAKKQGKFLFVDAYATWCGPCKYMDKNVFTDAEVAAYYNSNFISYKMDVDKETETAEKYGISAMPTYLFVDAAGEVVFRKTGAMGIPEFIQLGKSALEIPALQKKYDAGDRSPEFLANYLLANAENKSDKILTAASDYFKTQKDEDLLSETNFQLLKAFAEDVNSREFQYFLNHTAEFNEKYGEAAGEVAYQVLDKLYAKAIDNQDVAPLNELKSIIGRLDPIIPKEQAETITNSAFLSFYQQIKDWDNYALAALEFFEKNGTEDSEMLFNASYNFYNYVENKEYLSKALNWMKNSIEREENYINKYLYAALLHKLGNKDEALKQAREAKSIADKDGVDTSLIQSLIDKMEQN
ncbi:MAG: thioredoxin family protein [Microscillaceae bacterium]|nr:thioredoxin family protein [Microscillaceae bacterium]